MRVIAIVQARMGSTRLPGKVLADLCGATVLERCLTRLHRAHQLSGIVVATSTQRGDDPIADLARARRWNCYRGSEGDVLDRYFRAAQSAHAEIIVRVTSDCPLIEPALVDRVVGRLLRSPGCDYVSNFIPERTFPRGLDVEAFTMDALRTAWQEDRNAAWREHVTEFILHHPERFACVGVIDEADNSAWRWTVDEPDDLKFARTIYGWFGHDHFTWQEALAACRAHPEWRMINQHVSQKVVV